MPLPPDITSVSLFACERTIQESDGVLTAIRIVDVFWVPPRPPELAQFHPVIRAYGCALIKGIPGVKRELEIDIRMQNEDSSEYHSIGQPRKILMGNRDDTLPSGASVNIEMRIEARVFGTSYMCLFIDGREAARTPLSVLQQIEK